MWSSGARRTSSTGTRRPGRAPAAELGGAAAGTGWDSAAQGHGGREGFLQRSSGARRRSSTGKRRPGRGPAAELGGAAAGTGSCGGAQARRCGGRDGLARRSSGARRLGRAPAAELGARRTSSTGTRRPGWAPVAELRDAAAGTGSCGELGGATDLEHGDAIAGTGSYGRSQGRDEPRAMGRDVRDGLLQRAQPAELGRKFHSRQLLLCDTGKRKNWSNSCRYRGNGPNYAGSHKKIRDR